jgi:hypothetical protein
MGLTLQQRSQIGETVAKQMKQRYNGWPTSVKDTTTEWDLRLFGREFEDVQFKPRHNP